MKEMWVEKYYYDRFVKDVLNEKYVNECVNSGGFLLCTRIPKRDKDEVPVYIRTEAEERALKDPFKELRKLCQHYGDFVDISDAEFLQQELNKFIRVSKKTINNFDGKGAG